MCFEYSIELGSRGSKGENVRVMKGDNFESDIYEYAINTSNDGLNILCLHRYPRSLASANSITRTIDTSDSASVERISCVAAIHLVYVRTGQATDIKMFQIV